MSEHIAHVAVFEDTARLVHASGDFPDSVTGSLREAWDVGLTVSGARGNHLHAVPILEHYRSSTALDKDARAHISAALGWLTHRAADLQVKAIGRMMEGMLEGEEPTRIGEFEVWSTEMDAFQDAVIMREVYDGGRVQPASPYEPMSTATLARGMATHPAAEAVDVLEVEPLFAQEMRRDMLALHSFVDDEQIDLESWMDRVLQEEQEFTEDLEAYFFAFDRPRGRAYEHEEKELFYLDWVNFYNAGDQIIRWARALQRGSSEPSVPLKEAIAMARTQSQYAQMVYRAYQSMRGAADYLEGRIEKNALYDVVENYNPDHRL